MTNSKTKHTQGPWYAVYHPAITGGTIEVKQYPNELEIRYANSETSSIAEANARLIAAAPEMLEALQRVFDYSDISDDFRNEIKLIINKARGEK